ncbi:glycogen/starch synthase [Aliifodinibius sp. S!AR15-10]|uniref:glycogen/starch synthase n=1 Tax=Aliifodinibius sp. S!AR15-10 TaxID=2950437 RepID=UPI002857BBEB|nr:glycogen/starch synthase [Aliifodinibius sp. S!AR15-10]MDR8392977.1 glycogen/starch synthase [Aliifodinibius sp. S!AR15-10]
MKVLYAAAEISPFARMTNTADLLRFLPASLQDKGYEIRILLPKYGTINDRRNRLHEVIRLSGIEVEVGDQIESMRIKVASIPNAKLQVYFLDNDAFFERKALFLNPETNEHYDDNDQRLVFYNKGVLETVKKLGWEPDIIHCHDWPAGLIPLLVREKYKDVGIFKNSKIVYNIHHPENHGIFDQSLLDLIGLPDSFDRDQVVEDGKVDLRTIGLKFSDAVVTGNHLTDQLNGLFEKMGIEPTKIQGSPESVSNQFADYYDELAGE